MNIISSTVPPAVHPASHQACPPGSECKGRDVLLSRILFVLQEIASLSAGNLGGKGLTEGHSSACEAVDPSIAVRHCI